LNQAPKVVAGDVGSELDKVVSRRNLSDADVQAAALTYHPTGMHDEFLAVLTTGSSGRIAVTGMPSMRIMKYVGVFTPEPWQGFAYDDESKAILAASAREDIQYEYGDSGRPAFSTTAGSYDGHNIFVADRAHARVGVVDFHDYETKQVITNPVFKTSHGDVAVTGDSEYVITTTEVPEIPGAKYVASADLGKALRGGVTFWKTIKQEETIRIDANKSWSMELPPYLQSAVAIGRPPVDSLVFILGSCRAGASLPVNADACSGNAQAVLHIVDWRKAEAINGETVNGHKFIRIAAAVAGGALRQVTLADNAHRLAVSADGTHLAILNRTASGFALLQTSALSGINGAAGAADEYGVPTGTDAGAKIIDVGGPQADGVFGNGQFYAVVTTPGQLAKVDLAAARLNGTVAIPEHCSGVMLPEASTAGVDDRFIVVMNNHPTGRFVSVGPQKGLNPLLIENSATGMRVIYDMAVPQATGLAGVAINKSKIKTVYKYPVGTDTRTNKFSPYKTVPGEERVEREGKRVRIFGTLIRSHITPEIVEVEEGDIVTFHMTNLEQAQDQTHGFTVSAYNVHGSWEPGKTASVTFTADKPGVYPYYCTEFCSALHLEMKGYLLVKPKGWKPTKEDLAADDKTSTGEAKAQYEAKMKVIKETQAVIDSVVAWLKEHNFSRDERAAALVNDAVEQLSKAPAIQKKIDESVAAEDWPNAFLWAEQYFQYQVKAADAGLRAKKIISELGDK